MKVEFCLKKGRLRYQENRSFIKNFRSFLVSTAERAVNSLLLFRRADVKWHWSITASGAGFNAG